MATVKIPLAAHRKGDTWGPIVIGPVLINGLPPVNPAVKCRWHFRSKDGALGLGMSTAPAGNEKQIVITDAATWLFTIPHFIMDLSPGKWGWDCEITDSVGIVLTPYSGDLTIIQDVTHD